MDGQRVLWDAGINSCKFNKQLRVGIFDFTYTRFSFVDAGSKKLVTVTFLNGSRLAFVRLARPFIPRF